MQDCVYSTKYFNSDREICIYSNSLDRKDFIGVDIVKWDISLFDDTPIPKSLAAMFISGGHRDLSDLLRLVLLYKFGGSYIDTDDLCIRKMSEQKNLICRSYDPHTCFYNKIKDEDCLSGTMREIGGYDDIPIFPRNDCWQNFEPKHPFIESLLSDPRVQSRTQPIDICGEYSWQSLTLENCKKRTDYTLGLALLYLYESHVSVCSGWDRGDRGEMHDIYRSLPDFKLYPHGQYRCTKETALEFLNTLNKYPYLSHLWLHDKDMNPDWLREPREIELLSTQILNIIRKCIA